MRTTADEQAPEIASERHARLLTAAVVSVFALAAVPALLSIAASVASLVQLVILGTFLAALASIDMRTFRLPDVLTIPLLAIAFALAAASGGNDLMWSIASAVIGGLALYTVAAAYRKLRGRDGLGFGDIKLFAAAGAWVGVQGLPSVLLVACVTALAAVAALVLSGRKVDAQSAVPFGPFLAFGLWIVWLYGPLLG